MEEEKVVDAQQDINVTLDYGDPFMFELMTEILRDRNFAVMTIPNLEPEYFKDRKIWRDFFILIRDYFNTVRDIPANKSNLLDHIIDFQEKNKRVDIDDTIKKLIDTIYAKDQYDEFTFKTNKKFLTTKINDFIKLASVKRAYRDSYNKVVFARDYEAVRQILLKALSVGIHDVGTKVFVDIKRLLEEYKVFKDPKSRIPTPISFLNSKINNGIGRQELFVVVAPPNVGKSLAMISFAAKAVLRKKKIVYYTLEMSESKIAWRLIQCMGQFKSDDLLHQSARVQSKLNRIQEVISIDLPSETGKLTPSSSHKDIIVKGFTSRGCNINALYSHIGLLEAEGFYPDMIVVDYADLMEGPIRYKGEKRAELSAIYSGLRDLAVEKDVALVTASQANRAALNIKDVPYITMEHIAEDIGKAAIADVMISLNQTSVEYQDGIYRVYLMKNRDGEAKGEPFQVPVDYSTMSFGDAANSDDIEAALRSL